MLRSTKEIADVDQNVPITPTKNWSQHGMEPSSLGKVEIKAEFATRERAVLESTDTTAKGKARLLAVLRMERIAEEESLQGNPPSIAGFRHTVDRKGTIIFTMPSGGTIRDSGKELFFSARDKTAETAAMLYAQAKWGKSIQMEGNRLCRKEVREVRRGVER